MPEAAYLLGSMYYSGKESAAKDPVKAQELLDYAASNGNSTILRKGSYNVYPGNLMQQRSTSTITFMKKIALIPLHC